MIVHTVLQRHVQISPVLAIDSHQLSNAQVLFLSSERSRGFWSQKFSNQLSRQGLSALYVLVMVRACVCMSESFWQMLACYVAFSSLHPYHAYGRVAHSIHGLEPSSLGLAHYNFSFTGLRVHSRSTNTTYVTYSPDILHVGRLRG